MTETDDAGQPIDYEVQIPGRGTPRTPRTPLSPEEVEAERAARAEGLDDADLALLREVAERVADLTNLLHNDDDSLEPLFEAIDRLTEDDAKVYLAGAIMILEEKHRALDALRARLS